MITFQPMKPEHLANYLRTRAELYSQECVESGYWPSENAYDRAYAYISGLLPHGVATPNNYLFDIVHEETVVGTIWFIEHNQHEIRSLWIYHIEIIPQFRRRGFARESFLELERFAANIGVKSIGLHVFTQNDPALQFYLKMGYTVPGVNMVKQL